MFLRVAAVLFTSLLGISSARHNVLVTDSEGGMCGKLKRTKCNSGNFYTQAKKKLESSPVLEVDNYYKDNVEDVALALGSVEWMLFYFSKRCKNCVEDDIKEELCALSDPIIDGISKFVDDSMANTIEVYCPHDVLVCGATKHDECNGAKLGEIEADLQTAPKNGKKGANAAMYTLKDFFAVECKGCVDTDNVKDLCELSKPILKGILETDRNYVDPSAKFCNGLVMEQ